MLAHTMTTALKGTPCKFCVCDKHFSQVGNHFGGNVIFSGTNSFAFYHVITFLLQNVF